MGMTDFFTMEATDYLERLDAMVSAPQPPDAADYLRLSRALRGSAVMANQPQIGNIAGGLEGMARALVEHRVAWDEGTRQLAIRAVDDLKVLVRAIQTWSEAEDARVLQIMAELDRYTGRPTVERKLESAGLDSGTRAFIAREGAAVASALDQAARGVASSTNVSAGFDALARAMQPLRGIASLAELPPFPDLLEGVDRTVGEFQRDPNGQHDANILDTAAKAVSEVAQQISTGAPELSSPHADQFASMLGDLIDLETDVVPIQSLFFAGEGPHVVELGATVALEPLGRVELVSHLEYLVQAAHELDRSQSRTQRLLRIHATVPTLRALSIASGGPLLSAAASFAIAAKKAIESGAAMTEDGSFGRELRDGSQLLKEATQAPRLPPMDRLNALANAFPAAAGTTTPTPDPVAPAITPEPPPQAEAGVSAEDRDTDLAAAYLRCDALVQQFGDANGTLEQLVAGPPPAASPAQVPAPTVTTPDDIVMITDLQYESVVALARANELRIQVRMAVADGDTPTADALLDEIFDLVKIGQDTTG